MDDEIFDFLNRKREELEENKNFQEWYANNKLLTEEGEIVIAFHASRRKMFSQIEEDKLNTETHLLGGFYLTEDIYDAEDNYASETGGDYNNYLDKDVERLSGGYLDEEEIKDILLELDSSNLDEEVIEEIIAVISEADDIRTYKKSALERFGVNIERLAQLSEQHSFSNGEDELNDEDLLSDDFELDFNSFCKALILQYKYENDGWIMPLIVKMDKPCFTGFGKDDTKIIISSMTEDERIEDEESQANEYEAYEPVMDIKRTIAFECDLKPSQVDEKFEEIVDQCGYTNVEEIYEKYIEVLELLGVDTKKATDVCRNAFKEEAGDYISFDEDGDPDDSEEIYIPNYDIINGESECEAQELGDEIREALNTYLSDTSFLDSVLDQEINYDELLIAVKNVLYEPEEHKEFTQAMSTVFDGVVMNAYKANKENWNSSFALDYNARHYVIFNENCVKSAIGNKGTYSLYNNNFVEKRMKSLKESNMLALEKDAIEKHVDYIKMNWDTDANIELKSKSFFSKETSLSVLDKKSKTIYLNKDAIKDVETLEKTLTHELVGHFGLNEIFNKDVEKTLLRVANIYKKDLIDINKDYPEYDIKTKKGKLMLAEEFLANKAEQLHPDDSFIKKVKTMMKKAFIKFKKSLGLKTDIGEDVFELLEDSKKAIKVKKTRNRRMRR